MLPNFLVIGAPRSGTTWVEKNLREHPEVFLPKQKELHFFDTHYGEGMGYYEAHFEKWDGQKAIGEATPDYLHGEYSKYDVPALIKKHLPEVKLIASLRNPVERAYSRFWNSKAHYERNIGMSFEEKLKDRPEFIREGMYFDQLQRYYALFPRENILVLLFDDLVENPRSFMRQIYEFIGVEPEFKSTWESFKVNQASGTGNMARSQSLYQFSRILSRLRFHALADRVRRMNSLDQPPMSFETRKILRDIYFEQNCKLQGLIGRNLDHWNANGVR